MSAGVLDQLQEDVHGYLSAVPDFAGVNVLLDNQGDLEGRIETELASLHERSGKAGLAIIVLACEVSGTNADLPGPEMDLQVMVQCLELAELNRNAADGTLIRSSDAAARVLRALQHVAIGPRMLYPDKPAISPMKMRPGFVSNMVRLRTTFQQSPAARVASIVDSIAGDSVILECATEGAAIRYTLDGSFPSPSKTLYAGGIPIPAAGTIIRSAAYAAGLHPSDVLETRITP